MTRLELVQAIRSAETEAAGETLLLAWEGAMREICAGLLEEKFSPLEQFPPHISGDLRALVATVRQTL